MAACDEHLENMGLILHDVTCEDVHLTLQVSREIELVDQLCGKRMNSIKIGILILTMWRIPEIICVS